VADRHILGADFSHPARGIRGAGAEFVGKVTVIKKWFHEGFH